MVVVVTAAVIVVVVMVVVDVVMGLRVAIFVVAFNLESVNGPIGILAPQ